MNRRLINSACAAAVMGAALAAAHASAPEPNPDAATLADFKKRVEDYVDLRKRVVPSAAKQEETEQPGRIREAQQEQAARIREARKDAKPGDIFTREVRPVFRKLMRPQVKGEEGKQTKAAMKEDAPPPAQVRLEVNAPYPEGKPLPTVPPNVLANLPQLPEELEYRVVGKALILRDVNANLIVDFIPNVMQ